MPKLEKILSLTYSFAKKMHGIEDSMILSADTRALEHLITLT